jgi:hypothetical protein
MYLTEGEELWLDWGFEGNDIDIVKKLYVNEILSVLPPEYTMYPINVWPYNQHLVETDSVSTFIEGIDIDFTQISSKVPAAPIIKPQYSTSYSIPSYPIGKRDVPFHF